MKTKEEQREYSKQYREANREKLLAYQRERYRQKKEAGETTVQPPNEKSRARGRAAYAKKAEAKRALEEVTGVVKLKQKALSVTGLRASMYTKIADIFEQLDDRFSPTEVGHLAGIDCHHPMLKVVLGQSFRCWQTASGMWRKK